MFSPPWEWDDLRADLQRGLAAWRGTPFILGIADQLPPDGNIDFVPRIARYLEENP